MSEERKCIGCDKATGKHADEWCSIDPGVRRIAAEGRPDWCPLNGRKGGGSDRQEIGRGAKCGG